MKIGIVSLNLSFIAGGPRLIFGLAHSLEAAGHRVIIYAPDFDATYYKEAAAGLTIKVVRPPKPLIWTGRPKNIFKWIWHKLEQEQRFISASKQIAAAADVDLDVLNIHDFSYRTGYFYKKRNPSTQIIWTENAPPYMYVPKKNFFFNLLGVAYQQIKERSSKKYFRAMDKIAVLDIFNKNWCEERGLKNIAVVRCGVDFNKFYFPVKNFAERAKKRTVQLFALGALNGYRRYDIVMRSVKALRDDGIDARALIVANNIWHEDAVKKDLIQLAKELHLEPFIDFRFAGVTDAELREAYRAADFFVQAVYVDPPGNHGWGIVNFEGMSAGLPLILCNSATATEVLKDDESAFFVKPLSFEQIAEKVKRCITEPELYKKVGEAGQGVARGLTWAKYTEETLVLFGK